MISFFLLNQLSLRARIKNYDNSPRNESVTYFLGGYSMETNTLEVKLKVCARLDIHV